MGQYRRRRHPRSAAGVTLMLAGTILALWLIGTFCTTVVVAELIAQDSLGQNNELVGDAFALARLGEVYENGVETPGYIEYNLYEALIYAAGRSYSISAVNDTKWSFLRHRPHEIQSAGLILNADGSVFAETGDFLNFRYQTEEAWDAGSNETHIDGYARLQLDRDALTEAGREQFSRQRGYLDVYLLRLTGTLDGTEFTASKIEFIGDEGYDETLDSTLWQTAFSDPSLETDEDIVLYSDYARLSVYEPGGSVPYQGKTYDTLLDLVTAVAPEFESFHYIQTDSLSRQLTVRARYLYEPVEVGAEFPDYQLRYILLVGTYFSPMKAAVTELRSAYLWTFAFAFVLFWGLRGALLRHVIRPVERAADGMAEGFRYLGSPEEYPQKYADVYQLYDQYDAARLKLAGQRDEVRRLQTALDYAKQAEQNRREMTSHIAHELKTPLAVLHSYAEGLSSHIADDKRDRYLAVIQSETERMDAMVLEMLDLSRLEAGRVQLKREEFSLSELAMLVWARFEKAAADRGLRVTFDWEEPGLVSADRARIEQVVTNFLSNAVRYTKEGGTAAIRVTKSRGKVTFSVENDAEPLSSEALSKVFESFYRADESRSSPGTGLGLAICKRIVELHGGECAVRNTETGVEFRFTL